MCVWGGCAFACVFEKRIRERERERERENTRKYGKLTIPLYKLM